MKEMLFALLTGFVLCGCSPKLTSPLEPEEVATAMFRAFNEHQWEKMVSCYAPDAQLEDPSFPEPLSSTAGLAERFSAMQTAYPDLQDHIKHIFVSDNTVVVEFVASGTAADGSHSFSLPVTSILTIRNGKIIRDATYYDLQD